MKQRPLDKKSYWHRSDSKPETPSGLVQLFGRKPILEAMRLGCVRSLEISAKAHGRSIQDILQLARDQQIKVVRVDQLEVEEGLTVQGVRAWAEPPHVRHDLWSFLESLPEERPSLLLMLDGIEDPHNFGAILRSADGAGVSAVIIRERRQVPITEVVVKSSAGAAYAVPVFQVTNLSQALRKLAQKGYWSVAAVADETATYYKKYRWNGNVVLIVGAEGAGVSDLLCRDADDKIRIPMWGKIDSLNVSVATGILLFEAASVRFENNAMLTTQVRKSDKN